MPSMKLCLALVLVAATSTHVAAVELVNPLQVLERSRRAGIEFDKRMKRDAAEQTLCERSHPRSLVQLQEGALSGPETGTCSSRTSTNRGPSGRGYATCPASTCTTGLQPQRDRGGCV